MNSESNIQCRPTPSIADPAATLGPVSTWIVDENDVPMTDENGQAITG